MMLLLPKEYETKLNLLETQKAIKLCKDTFERELSKQLNLTRVSAPLYVFKNSGLNDGLSGVERPVTFDIKDIDEVVEVVQSLAKWKRFALKKYGFRMHEGLYTDMNAIRRDEILDNIHSTYVDQWDYEVVIDECDRNFDYLKKIVKRICIALNDTQSIVSASYPFLEGYFKEDVYFITSQELLDLYPNLSPKEREDAICKKHQVVFIIGIGDSLSNMEKHDNRAFDYDDWSLNGDLLVWYPLFNRAVEISSMGIRVDSITLDAQAQKAKIHPRELKLFHRQVLNNELPLTLGGGIGQSRMCMIMLNKAHVGEVQASLWPEDMIELCERNKMFLL